MSTKKPSIKGTLYEKDLYADEELFQMDCAAIARERLERGEIDRRTFLKALGLIGMLPAVATLGRDAHAAAGEVVVVNWGGPAVDAYMKAFGEPFEKATGMKVVIDGTGPLGSKIRAMVEAKNVTWDVCDTGAGTTLVLAKAGVIEPIDYTIVDRTKVLPEFAFEHGVVNYMFSFILAYNKKTNAKIPQNWRDFWNLAEFPGKRTMRKQPNGMMESCMLAAGRSLDKVYPIDIPLAISKFKEIKDEVIIWGSGSQSQQLFREQEVVMGNIWHTRANLLRRDMGGDVDWTWNEGCVAPGMWNVPIGNPAGKDNAMKFIASAQDPDQQIELFKAMGNGPANPAAAPKVPEDMRAFDPGQPENLAMQVPFNGKWYEEDYGNGKTNDQVSRELWLEAQAS
ncbi:MAG: ABC transporter substrate-binding protein [Ectothiorhodospiraceae bacterium]|nr:ABC transporter substrate-binding protein [Ectothiorhodospiraceae bacterium]